jgi:hypothetical protein
MVALAISSAIMAAVSLSIRDLMRTQASRKLITEVQGEGLGGLTRLQEEVREASLGSQTGTVITATPAGVQPRPTVQIFDNVPGGGFLDVKPGTDALLLVSAAARFVTFDGLTYQILPIQASVAEVNFDPVATPLRVTEVGGFAPGQFVMVGAYKSAGWLRVDRVVGLAGAPGELLLSAPGNVLPDQRADAGSLVRVATARLYYVNGLDELVLRSLTAPRAPGAAAEMGDPEVIARGMENFQVDCALDGGGLGYFTPCPAAATAGDVWAESQPSGLANPRLEVPAIETLRTITLGTVVRSTTALANQGGEEAVVVGNEPKALLPSGVPDPNAQFARRSYRMMVGVRNTSLGNL